MSKQAKPAATSGKSAAAAQLLQQMNPETQRQQQEKLTNAMKAHAEVVAKKNAELAELKKIKVDSAVVKYLVAEFSMAQADVELMLRQNGNDLDTVLGLILAKSQ